MYTNGVSILLGVASVFLAITHLHTKKANKDLLSELESTQARLLQISDKDIDCTKNLAHKTAEIEPKDKTIETLGEEKKQLEEKIKQLTADLETFKQNQTSLVIKERLIRS